MIDDTDEYKISWWLSEFADPAMEQSFQNHVQHIINLQLRVGLIVWGVLLLLFAIPDYIALGLSKPFYYLLVYRIAIVVALLILFFRITPETNFVQISYLVTMIIIIGFSGFMLLFIYRPDTTNWIVAVIMLQLIGLLIFIPIRLIMSFSSAVYGVFITMLTRWAMGSSRANLIGLFFLLMLPVVIGAASAIRLGILQRKQFALLSRTEKINLELQKALAANEQLSGLIPICSSCKKIRNDDGYWEQIEGYIRDHTKAEFSHGICPNCAKKLYPDIYIDK